MMYRPSLKSDKSLIILFVVSIVLFYIAQTSYVHIKSDYYEEKIAAAELMKSYMDAIRADLESQNFEFDPIDDPMRTGLIGTRLSSITTSRGFLSEKQASLNPNLAAVFVQELKKARLSEGDHIAVGITGSNPSVNLALFAAIQTLKLNPSIITALSSSSFGANREELTWLDIESILKKNNLISFSTSYASLGGMDDLAIGLTDTGVQSLRASMQRNGVPLLVGANLADNVELRYQAYNELLPSGKRYRLFVNIGMGLANVGSQVNARLISEGLNTKIAERQYEPEGVMMLMAKKNVHVLHFTRVMRWVRDYDLPTQPLKTPEIGKGRVFSYRIHNFLISLICLILLAAAIIVVIIFDRHDRRFMANIVDPDDEL